MAHNIELILDLGDMVEAMEDIMGGTEAGQVVTGVQQCTPISAKCGTMAPAPMVIDVGSSTVAGHVMKREKRAKIMILMTSPLTKQKWRKP